MEETIGGIWSYIREADRVISGTIHRTPLDKSATFSNLTGGEIYLKLENLQKTGSFKIRGAYYKIWKTIREKKIDKCIAASAGNHAQGVAYAASQLGIKSTIVMPEYTPVAKILATRGYGADVILHGKTYDDAYNKAVMLSEGKEIEYIHGFDDPYIIAGQGTIGLEIYRELGGVDAVVVPVGGGGLISGIAIAIKHLNPKVKIYGVQAKGANAMYLSYREGEPVKIASVDTIADGIAIKTPGELTFKIISELVDDIVLVDDNEIVQAMFMLLERCKTVAEPAGSAGVAAILNNKVDVEGKKVVAVVSGGNVDMPLLSTVIERALVMEGRQARIKGVLPDRPGMLKVVSEVIAEAKANIVSIEHDRLSLHLPPGKAEVTLTIEVPEPKYVEELIAKLRGKGFNFKALR